ncbi:ATP-dependent DNA helicase [Trichonephila clavipes]|nr:ATP-dependent DNA helicase [Trichonephila clavipes]
MVVLPSSFTGGSRYMHERTQDAMTYVRHFGRPDLFITFTCNPKWSEIVDLLNQGQKSHDRHDIIARVFRVKVKHMIRLLTKGCIFGNVRCHMYTVEWQKRGLPHVHILLWLKDKIRPEYIDKVICAELPDSKLDPALYEIIRTTMIHGPCGHINKSSPCMLNGNCTKNIQGASRRKLKQEKMDIPSIVEDLRKTVEYEIVAENAPKLNQEQKEIYGKILNSISSNSGQCYFLDSPGGTGKTFLINLLLAKIRCERSIAIAVASSGIAATLIDGGKTAHSAFKLPLNLHHSESVNCNISKQSDMAHVLREAKLITWDECTMAHKKGIEALNRTLQDIRGCNQIMGGLTVLLSGDFRQTLPVVLRGTRAFIVKACLKTSFLWPHIKVVSLRINMRVHICNMI